MPKNWLKKSFKRAPIHQTTYTYIIWCYSTFSARVQLLAVFFYFEEFNYRLNIILLDGFLIRLFIGMPSLPLKYCINCHSNLELYIFSSYYIYVQKKEIIKSIIISISGSKDHICTGPVHSLLNDRQYLVWRYLMLLTKRFNKLIYKFFNDLC